MHFGQREKEVRKMLRHLHFIRIFEVCDHLFAPNCLKTFSKLLIE